MYLFWQDCKADMIQTRESSSAFSSADQHDNLSL
jgi:hypothetical protein